MKNLNGWPCEDDDDDSPSSYRSIACLVLFCLDKITQRESTRLTKLTEVGQFNAHLEVGKRGASFPLAYGTGDDLITHN